MSKEKVGARRSDGPTRDGAEPEVCMRRTRTGRWDAGTRGGRAHAPSPCSDANLPLILDFGTVYASKQAS